MQIKRFYLFHLVSIAYSDIMNDNSISHSKILHYKEYNDTFEENFSKT